MAKKFERLTPSDVRGMKVSELRKLLGRYNREARIRNKRLEKSGFSGIKVVPVKGLKKNELQSQLVDLSIFLMSKTSRVKYAKEALSKRLDTLKDRGYDFISADIIRQFGEFMDLVKERHGRAMFDSDTAARIYEMAEKKGINPLDLEDAFGRYLADEKGLKDLEEALSNKPIKDGRTSAAKIRKVMGDWGWI